MALRRLRGAGQWPSPQPGQVVPPQRCPGFLATMTYHPCPKEPGQKSGEKYLGHQPTFLTWPSAEELLVWTGRAGRTQEGACPGGGEKPADCEESSGRLFQPSLRRQRAGREGRRVPKDQGVSRTPRRLPEQPRLSPTPWSDLEGNRSACLPAWDARSPADFLPAPSAAQPSWARWGLVQVAMDRLEVLPSSRLLGHSYCAVVPHSSTSGCPKALLRPIEFLLHGTDGGGSALGHIFCALFLFLCLARTPPTQKKKKDISEPYRHFSLESAEFAIGSGMVENQPLKTPSLAYFCNSLYFVLVCGVEKENLLSFHSFPFLRNEQQSDGPRVPQFSIPLPFLSDRPICYRF